MEVKKHRLLAEAPDTFWFKVKSFLFSIHWFFTISEDKKTRDEFYNGLIEHKCEFDYENIEGKGLGKYCCCKHHGCNFVTMRKTEGGWL